jgi:hypothetical protein
MKIRERKFAAVEASRRFFEKPSPRMTNYFYRLRMINLFITRQRLKFEKVKTDPRGRGVMRR